MSETLKRIRRLVAAGDVRISAHGHNELVQDRVRVGEALAGLPDAVVVEDYPNFHKGPCVLVLELDSSGDPIHVLWGIPKGRPGPAVILTAYRTDPQGPDPYQWNEDFTWEMRAMTRKETKLLLEGDLAAKVEVDLIESDEPWAPYLSLGDLTRLSQVRLALRRGDVAEALKFGRVYRLTPITAP